MTDWLRARPASGDLLDRAADVVPRLAPAALLGCGVERTRSQLFDDARALPAAARPVPRPRARGRRGEGRPGRTNAVLVVCVGAEENGAVVDTCFYERKPGDLRPPLLPGQVDPGHEVTFHKLVLPVKVYGLRTAKLVSDSKITIGGASCPKVLDYETYVQDLGPPGDVAATPGPTDMRAAFQRVIVRG